MHLPGKQVLTRKAPLGTRFILVLTGRQGTWGAAACRGPRKHAGRRLAEQPEGEVPANRSTLGTYGLFACPLTPPPPPFCALRVPHRHLPATPPPPIGLMWATLTTNIAANVVAPANAFVNVAPKLISFEVGPWYKACSHLHIHPCMHWADQQAHMRVNAGMHNGLS